MFDHIAAEAWSAEAIWSWYSARQSVHEARDALHEAGAALLPLIDQSAWHAKGVMALHELIIELRGRAASEAGALTDRLWEIESLVGS